MALEITAICNRSVCPSLTTAEQENEMQAFSDLEFFSSGNVGSLDAAWKCGKEHPFWKCLLERRACLCTQLVVEMQFLFSNFVFKTIF